MGIKKYILYCLCMLSAFPLAAQLEDGSYQGFKVVKNDEQPEVITINVLSLGNGICHFSEEPGRKALQGTYHLIIHRNKYYIGEFKKGIANGNWEKYWYGLLEEKGTLKNGQYDGNYYEYKGKGPENNKFPTVYTFKDGVVQHYIAYYPENGQIEVERFYDEKGRQHGEMKTYDNNGTLKEIETYQHGVRNGRQMYIDSQGYKENSEYANGKLSGDYCRYYPNGNISSKGYYESGNKTGKWIYGEQNGDVRSEYNYLNDKQHGEQRTYYAGNILRSIEEYENGILNGKRIDYDEDPHVLYSEANYVNGQRSGEFKIYYKGILWKEGVIKDNRTVCEKEYEKGKLQIIRLLDEKGELVNVEQYNKSGQKTYKNKNFKKHSSITLKENAAGVIDVEVE